MVDWQNVMSLVEAIEAVRLRHRIINQENGHADGKRYRLEDIYAVYPNYKNLRNGRVKYHLPSRHDVLQIIEELECTVNEANKILLAGAYAPIIEYLEGEELEEKLKSIRQMLHFLTLPAWVITRDWRVRDWNAAMLTFLGWKPAQIRSIEPEKLNILYLLFNPDEDFGLRCRFEKSAWEQVARRSLYRFKRDNILGRHDSWYKSLLGLLGELPDFERIWNSVEIDAPSPFKSADYTIEMRIHLQIIIRFYSLHISLGDRLYPMAMCYIPADNGTENLFTQLGLRFGGN